MSNDVSFKIVQNNLSGKSFAKSLIIENIHYIIKIFYAGDYDEDRRLNQIDNSNISISCKSKSIDLTIDYMQGQSVIELNTVSMLYPSQVEIFKNQLNIANDSAVELDKVIKEYFPVS